MERYLIHHGVEGQKWGVRHGPPYPIEDKVLKSGTRLNSVSSKSSGKKNLKFVNKERKGVMYTYRKDEEWDNKVYKGPFSHFKNEYSREAKTDYAKRHPISTQLTNGKYNNSQFRSAIKEHQYVTVKDLKMPTSSERFSEFENLIKSGDDPLFGNHYISEMRRFKNQMFRPDYAEYVPKNLKEFNFDDIFQKDYSQLNAKEKLGMYRLFNHMMELSHQYIVTRDYMEIMSRKYDAMVDDNNVGTYNDAHDPIIVFASKDVLDVIEKSKTVTLEEIKKNEDEIRKELGRIAL